MFVNFLHVPKIQKYWGNSITTPFFNIIIYFFLKVENECIFFIIIILVSIYFSCFETFLLLTVLNNNEKEEDLSRGEWPLYPSFQHIFFFQFNRIFGSIYFMSKPSYWCIEVLICHKIYFPSLKVDKNILFWWTLFGVSLSHYVIY